MLEYLRYLSLTVAWIGAVGSSVAMIGVFAATPDIKEDGLGIAAFVFLVALGVFALSVPYLFTVLA